MVRGSRPEFLSAGLLPVLQGSEGQAGSMSFLKAASLLGQSLGHKQPPPPLPAPPSLRCELRAAVQSACSDRSPRAAMGSGGGSLPGAPGPLPLLLLLVTGKCCPPLS